MNVLITGINGFIGSKSASMLKAKNYTIIGADIQCQNINGYCDEYHQIDLGSAESYAAFRRLPAVDYILHAAGISGFMVETDNPRRIVDVNICGTVPVLDMARRVKCRRVVLCSTVMVFGPEPDVLAMREETEYPEPISVYGASKVAVEALMHAFRGQYGVDAVALRFTHVYGPGRATECFIRDMLAAAAESRQCPISQASGSLRQYVHVDDVCRAIELAMHVEAPQSRVFNISAEEIHTLAEVAGLAQRVTGGLDVSFDETRDLPNYRIGKLSIERARSQLGYEPRLPLSEGLERYWHSSFVVDPGQGHR